VASIVTSSIRSQRNQSASSSSDRDNVEY